MIAPASQLARLSGEPEGGVGNVKSDMFNQRRLLFRDNGILISYPQRVIHTALDRTLSQ